VRGGSGLGSLSGRGSDWVLLAALGVGGGLELILLGVSVRFPYRISVRFPYRISVRFRTGFLRDPACILEEQLILVGQFLYAFPRTFSVCNSAYSFRTKKLVRFPYTKWVPFRDGLNEFSLFVRFPYGESRTFFVYKRLYVFRKNN
jgi:hypothetical protein